ncbi:jg11891 [Pararge aegeria aegeria]|uniref:Jg11891 protein n=1 Tax=Pararge aegeria aegeria TaxID=348720 RepID=A0A8S4SP50_9NEOP|nr:jg11891 [Pararge aegeria aegeria]
MDSIKQRGPFNTLSEFGNLERFDKTIMRIHPLSNATHARPSPFHPQLRPYTSLVHTPTTFADDALTFDIDNVLASHRQSKKRVEV